MRPVSGFDRPSTQWAFVLLSLVLIAICAIGAVALRRARAAQQTLRVADLNGRLDRQALEMRFAREQSAREALSLEVSRLRGTALPAGAIVPTLTLSPLKARGASPPQPTVDAPAVPVAIELRLMLPRGADRGVKAYTAALRNWSGGEQIWSRGALKETKVEGRPAVVAPITGDILTPGAYEILLTAVFADGRSSEVASYEVTVRPPTP